MSEYYELVPLDPIQKLERELLELKQLLKKEKEKKEEKIESNNIDLEPFVKTTLELQMKISELVVAVNDLTKEIKKLVEILKEAAVEEITKEEASENNNNVDLAKTISQTLEKYLGNLNQRFEILEKQNNKIIELLNDISKKLEKKEEKKVLPPVPPKPLLPPPPINKI